MKCSLEWEAAEFCWKSSVVVVAVFSINCLKKLLQYLNTYLSELTLFFNINDHKFSSYWLREHQPGVLLHVTLCSCIHSNIAKPHLKIFNARPVFINVDWQMTPVTKFKSGCWTDCKECNNGIVWPQFQKFVVVLTVPSDSPVSCKNHLRGLLGERSSSVLT